MFNIELSCYLDEVRNYVIVLFKFSTILNRTHSDAGSLVARVQFHAIWTSAVSQHRHRVPVHVSGHGVTHVGTVSVALSTRVII